MTVEEEDEMFAQQKDLLQSYKETYGGWEKIPSNKFLPSFKLLKVNKNLGLNGILRKLGIDPAPIGDEQTEEGDGMEVADASPGIVALVSLYFIYF